MPNLKKFLEGISEVATTLTFPQVNSFFRQLEQLKENIQSKNIIPLVLAIYSLITLNTKDLPSYINMIIHSETPLEMFPVC